MAFPKIGYDDFVGDSTSTVTASSTASGFAAANIGDLRPYTLWKSNVTTTGQTIDIDAGSAVTADYLAIVGHNWKTIAANVQIKADSSSPPTTVVASFNNTDLPTNDRPFVKEFDSTNKRYWRIQLNNGPFSAAPFLGVLFLGEMTTFTEYMPIDFDPHELTVEANGIRSRGGEWLGATVDRVARSFRFRFADAGAVSTFYTGGFNTFIDTHLRQFKPFFFVYDTDTAEYADAYYLVLDPRRGSVKRPFVGSQSRLNLDFTAVDAWSESA